MLKKIECPSCKQKNFIQNYKCMNCGIIIRDKIVNINLGDALKYLIISPKFILQRIFLAEHKNYSLILFLLLNIKLLIYHCHFLNVYDLDLSSIQSYFLLTVLILVFNLTFLIITQNVISILARENLSLKNLSSIFIYSLSFFSLSVIILFPLEWMQFGYFLFSRNPSMFEINSLKSIIIYFIESILIIYSLLLLCIGLSVFLSKIIYALMVCSTFLITQIIIFIINKKLIGVIYGI